MHSEKHAIDHRFRAQAELRDKPTALAENERLHHARSCMHATTIISLNGMLLFHELRIVCQLARQAAFVASQNKVKPRHGTRHHLFPLHKRPRQAQCPQKRWKKLTMAGRWHHILHACNPHGLTCQWLCNNNNHIYIIFSILCKQSPNKLSFNTSTREWCQPNHFFTFSVRGLITFHRGSAKKSNRANLSLLCLSCVRWVFSWIQHHKGNDPMVSCSSAHGLYPKKWKKFMLCWWRQCRQKGSGETNFCNILVNKDRQWNRSRQLGTH